ncbi:MAG TPA: protein kinase, partial [Thermoanaerobaculia bacterium]|nr:protein kinase [Thermoanaerobaculia bacterium]
MTALSPEIESTYEVLQTMGGGMGAVYKVRHRLFGEVRIIKVMQAALKDDNSLRGRFSAEAKRGKQLKHRNIAEVLDFLIGSDGNAYLVMEYVDGVNLRDEFARTGPIDPKTVVAIGVQALAGLGYLHSKNLVHRDISPDNLMMTKDQDGSMLVKLIDLGIAKSLEDTVAFTRAGDFIGKLSYASPEQFGEKVDARSDFYSLGIVLYELLTAFKPITATNTAAFVMAHFKTPPRPFSETDPLGHVPEALRRVILKALAKQPEDRYQTADEFSAALSATISEIDETGAGISRTVPLADAAARPPTRPPTRPAAPPPPPPRSAAPPPNRPAAPPLTQPLPQPSTRPATLPSTIRQTQPDLNIRANETIRTVHTALGLRQGSWRFIAIAASLVLVAALGSAIYLKVREHAEPVVAVPATADASATSGQAASSTIDVSVLPSRPTTTTTVAIASTVTDQAIIVPIQTTGSQAASTAPPATTGTTPSAPSVDTAVTELTKTYPVTSTAVTSIDRVPVTPGTVVNPPLPTINAS